MGRMDDELDAEFPEEGKRFDAAMDRILNPDDYVKPENLQVGTPRPDTQAAPASDWCSCDEGLVRDCPIHGEWPNPTLDQTTTKGDTDG